MTIESIPNAAATDFATGAGTVGGLALAVARRHTGDALTAPGRVR